MSRIGKKIIILPEKVTATIVKNKITVKGPLGELWLNFPSLVTVKQDKEGLKVTVDNEKEKLNRSLWGTYAALIMNLVEGVTKGFTKQLMISGVGFTWEVKGQKLTLKIGFSHLVEYILPKGITGKITKNLLTISGIDKQLVGSVAAQIRALKKPEPYKGKGIKYADEIIKKKAGKQATSAAAS